MTTHVLDLFNDRPNWAAGMMPFDDWYQLCQENKVVFPINHNNQPRTRTKGEITPYRECLNLCKSHGLKLTHLRAIRYHLATIGTLSFVGFWELLHDQIKLLTAGAVALEYEKIQNSRVLKQLRQKIPLNHISRLVGDFLRPRTTPAFNYCPRSLPWVPTTFRGLGVTFNGCYYRNASPDPKLLEALDYFKIQHFKR